MKRLLWKNIAPGRAFHAHFWKLDHHVLTHCHDFWEAFLVLESGGTQLLNGRKVPLRARTLHLIRPDDAHTMGPSSVYINIAWPAPPWEAWCDLAGLGQRWETLVIAPVMAPELEPLFRRMNHQFARGDGRPDLEIARFWGEIAARLWPSPSDQDLPDWMARAVQNFENEHGLRAGFTELLRTSHVSPGHLAREWKRVFDQTPTQWICQRRLQVAAQLLLQTSLSIKEIAARCGFDSLHYFYRAFGREFGASPKVYRQKSATKHAS